MTPRSPTDSNFANSESTSSTSAVNRLVRVRHGSIPRSRLRGSRRSSGRSPRQGIATSVDTMRASVAEAAIEAGVTIINDVSGGRADPNMASVVASAQRPVDPDALATHRRVRARRREHPLRRRGRAKFATNSSTQVDAAVAAGVDPENLILDPGLGFAKEPDHNWELLQRLSELIALGFPVLIGASRKRFLGRCSPTRRNRAPAGRTGSRHRSGLGPRRDTRCVGRASTRRAGESRCTRRRPGMATRQCGR